VAKTSKDTDKLPPSEKNDQPFKTITDLGSNLGGFFGKLGALIEKLGELAETGEELKRSGQFEDAAGKVRGVYGFTIKTGLGETGQPQYKVEPFGNIRCRKTGETVVDEICEPPADIFEEDDHVLVTAEIPGVGKKDVQVELSGNRLTIAAKRGKIRFNKDVVLPQEFSSEKMHWNCKNGILNIHLDR
jgi:HSP20 family protein